MVTVEQVQQLKVIHREAIPTDYFDRMEHMDIRWYMEFYEDATWIFFHFLVLGDSYFSHERSGIVALKQFIQYLAAVRAGDMVAIHGRVLERAGTKVHFMLFMINETTHTLASTFEVLGEHVLMRTQRSEPYHLPIFKYQDDAIAEQNALGWDAPVCGLISL